jgi:hypothetical protein
MSIWTSLASWAKSGAPSSSSVLNTGLQMLTNYKNRQNALQDQQRLNAYNSPQQQMQRFKEAGLNPNLIYNQQNTGQPVRSTDYVAPQIKETQLDVLGKSNNLKMQNQQLSNMELQNEAIKAQIMKTKADALYVASNTKFKDLDYLRLQGSLPGLVEGIQLRNLKYKEEIANTIADTQNKVAQLPIQESTKKKLDAEIQKLYTSNQFIKLEKTQQLAYQKALMSNITIMGNNMLKQGISEGMRQELMSQQMTKLRAEISKLGEAGDELWDKTMDIFGIFGDFIKPNKPKK